VATRSRSDVAIYAPLAGSLYEAGGAWSGGAELQSYLLARALADSGLSVRHIVVAPPAEIRRPADIELVLLGSGYAAGGAARRAAIVRALRAAAAQVYIQRSAGFETAMVGTFARALGRRLVFSSSSDADFARDRETARRAGAGLDDRATRLQYQLGLRLANAVVVQTNDQAALARRRVRANVRLIRSFALPAAAEERPREAFLWVGGLIEFKDPLAYVELARRVPEASFWMIGTDRGPEWSALAARVRDKVAEVPNLELLPPRSREQLLELYGRAIALVSTSYFEGFANAFLEAWARGTPVLSFRIDPDRIIERNGLGVAASGSMDRLADAVRDAWAHRAETPRADAARTYIERAHAPDVVGPQWAELVSRLLRDGRRRSST